MGERIRSYPWDSPWAPQGALTDSPPNSPQRQLLDTLTDPNGDYQIPTSEIDKSYQTARGKWKLKEAGNNTFLFAEAFEFTSQNPQSRKYFRPAWDTISLIDPSDPRYFSDPIKQRIENIQADVEQKIGRTPQDPFYCWHFVPQFFKQGKDSFQKGGLCFASETDKPSDFPVEAPAAQVFQACKEDSTIEGHCSEKAYSVLGAFEYLGVCQLDAASYFYPNGPSHLLVEYLAWEMDYSEVRRREEASWGKRIEKAMTHRQLIAAYYTNLAGNPEPVQIALPDGTQDLLIDPIYAGKMAVFLDPESPEAHSNLSTALLRRNYPEGAIPGYRRALELRENYPRAHYKLGNILLNKGNLEEALGQLRKAFETDVLGVIQELKNTLELNKGNADVHTFLGLAYYLKGDLDGALLEYREAMDLKPCDAFIFPLFRMAFRQREEEGIQFFASLNPFFGVK